uniref:Uncharacterized protein n=1 Tax=Globisporangium ultimum (strain ATCC 200006 / CBS 805.95 / DAOM BR144) TaxID=431595 RepID=K3WDJ5_GLOUD
MNDAEDVCGCLACAALCGVCCVAAAEEDKRERERAAAEATGRLKTPMIQVNPVAVLSPRSQKAERGVTMVPSSSAAGGDASHHPHYQQHEEKSPPRRNARKTASYRSNAYLPQAY